MTLHDDQGRHLVSRAISSQERNNPLLLSQVLERIRRDLIINQEPLQIRGSDYFRRRIGLPTSHDSSNWHLTRRKVLAAGGRLRTMSLAY